MADLSRGLGQEIAAAWAATGGGLRGPVIVSVGTEDVVRVVPARVFRYAITVRASGVVLAHNHPVHTGPSESDRAVTRRLVAAGRTLGVPLLAHLVVEDGGTWEVLSGAVLPAPPDPTEPQPRDRETVGAPAPPDLRRCHLPNDIPYDQVSETRP